MKIRMGFVSNSSSSSFIVGFGSVPVEKELEFEEHMKSLGATVSKRNMEKFSFYKNWLFPTMIGKEMPESFHCVSYYGNEGYSAFEDEDGYDYSKASIIDYYDNKRQTLIKILQDGVYFDKSKPYDCVFGAEFC